MNQMTNEIQPQRMSALLSQVATVATFNSKSLGLMRTDKDASIESDRSHNAKEGTGRTSASRLPAAGDRVKEINRAAIACSDALKRWTTAWGDRRLLANVNIQPFLQEWMELKAEYDRLVARFIADAPTMIAAAPYDKGTYKVEPPTIEDVENAFSLDFAMEQIPDSESFAARGMDKAVEDELKRRFEANIAAAYQQAQNDALLRLQKPLAAIVERMNAYNQREEAKANGIDTKEGYFRDTLMTNLRDISTVFASFNLTNDPALSKISEQLDAFDNIDAEDLKKSRPLRDDTAKRAQAILATLGDWL